MKIYVDCNVLLDWALAREPFYEDSSLVINAIEQGKFVGVLSALTVANVYYVIQRLHDKHKAEEFLAVANELFSFVVMSDSCVQLAIKKRHKDFEDDLHFFCAKENDVAVIVTRNIKDFPNDSTIQICSPTEFLNLNSLFHSG